MNLYFAHTYTIADVTLSFQTQQPVTITDSFRPFNSEKHPDYLIEFKEVSALRPFPEKRLYEGISFTVAQNDGGEYYRWFRDAANENIPYAVGTYDWENKRIMIEYLPYGKRILQESGSCFFHIAWEALLMHEHRMMLHAACVDTPLGGLLFSGPSGIGKSTQADLWCRYADGHLLNGDRTILYEADEGWRAYGSPYAGSSKCYVNENCNVRAIIFLQQASECSLRRMDSAEGFRRIYACLTVNSWDAEYVSAACDFAMALVTTVPVYELACTSDYNAVKMLKDELSSGGESSWIKRKHIVLRL